MQISRTVILVILGVSIAIAGFAAGSFAGAYVLGEPGSEFDPLIAESYFKEGVETATATLKNQITALQEQVDELRFKLDALEIRAGLVSSSTKPTPSAGGTSTTPKPTAPSSSEGALTGKTGIITPPEGANLRTGPGSPEYDIIRALERDTVVEILGTVDGWHEVKLSDGTKGWVSAGLIKID
ncbi:MAG: SH3 domain-containing protein [Bacillota bacterium]